jgi:2-dehydro-3-deoxy-D-arabinonate dehydratase
VKICRFQTRSEPARLGLITEADAVVDLSAVADLHSLLAEPELLEACRRLEKENVARLSLEEVRLCAPVDRQEVWAAGVTYLRSKRARMEESDFSATAYDRVYEAERPELFFKSLAEKVAGPEQPVGIRRDAHWSVPEPELALVLNSSGRVVGYTIGNDMSSRDIEGENLLYLPQAKIYRYSCALGPWIVVGKSEPEAREWPIAVQIQRGDETVFKGETSVGQIKRSFEELAKYLFRSQQFPHGAVLLTGTGVIPPDSFTLHEGDSVQITVGGIGRLRNTVVMV